MLISALLTIALTFGAVLTAAGANAGRSWSWSARSVGAIMSRRGWNQREVALAEDRTSSRAESSMQDIVEELIRWVGYAGLRLVTLGRYRGGTMNDRLSEGAIGLGIVIGFAFLTYSVAS